MPSDSPLATRHSLLVSESPLNAPSPARGLAGALAALIVARSLLADTTLARTDPATGVGGVVLNLLTLMLASLGIARAAVAGSPGRAVGREWFGWLAVLAGLIASTALSGYAHPGVYTAWDWAALLAVYALARSSDRAAQPGLMAVVLASAMGQGAGVLIGAGSAALAGPDLASPLPVPADALPGVLGLCLPLLVVVAVAGVRSGLGLTLVLPALAAVGALALLKPWEAFAPTYARTAVVDLIFQAPLAGMGPGNDLEALPRVWPGVSADGPEPAESFWLTLAATGGVPTAVVLALTLGGLAVSFWRTRPDDAGPSGLSLGTRAELAIGGMVGLTLGFALAVADLPADAGRQVVLRAGLVACLRGAVWFGTFALLDTLELGPRVLRHAVAAGLVLFAVWACVRDGGGSVAALTPVAALVALARNARRPDGATAPARRWVAAGGWALAGAAFAFVSVYPAWTANAAVRAARQDVLVRAFDDRRVRLPSVPQPDRPLAGRELDAFVVRAFLDRLTPATGADAGNAPLLREELRWLRRRWDLSIALASFEHPSRDTALRKAADIGRTIDARIERLLAADRVSADSAEAAFEALNGMARQSKARRAERLTRADECLNLAAERDPSRKLRLRRELLETLFAVGDAEDQTRAQVGALALLKADHRAEGPRHRLRADQRETLLRRLGDPPAAIVEEWLARP